MTQSKSVIVIGGTGFLGYHAICEFLRRGYKVTAMGLPPAPPADLYPAAVKVIIKDVEKASDDELRNLFTDHEALVFAAGADDRIIPKKSAYSFFHRTNVEVPIRILNLAKQVGVKRAVVLGSYFVHFHHLWPEIRLAEHHPYIRSRVEQEQAVTSIPGIEVCVLEFPYIFGSLPIPGWKPLWQPLVKYLYTTSRIFYMRGGTNCISAKTAGQAIVGATEYGKAGMHYLIGDENLNWVEMLTRLARAEGRIICVKMIPNWLLKVGLIGFWFALRLQGKESGLDPLHLLAIQTAKTFFNAEESRKALKYEIGRLDEAFKDTVDACKVALLADSSTPHSQTVTSRNNDSYINLLATGEPLPRSSSSLPPS